MQCLDNKIAWHAAMSIMKEIGPVFRDDEKREAFQLILEHCQAAIETAMILQRKTWMHRSFSRN